MESSSESKRPRRPNLVILRLVLFRLRIGNIAELYRNCEIKGITTLFTARQRKTLISKKPARFAAPSQRFGILRKFSASLRHNEGIALPVNLPACPCNVRSV